MSNTISIANIPLPVQVTNFPSPDVSGSLTATVSRLPANQNPTIALQANPLRKKFILCNENNAPLYVLYATAQSTAGEISVTNYTILLLNPNDILKESAFQGFVSFFCPANPGGQVQITELS